MITYFIKSQKKKGLSETNGQFCILKEKVEKFYPIFENS